MQNEAMDIFYSEVRQIAAIKLQLFKNIQVRVFPQKRCGFKLTDFKNTHLLSFQWELKSELVNLNPFFILIRDNENGF